MILENKILLSPKKILNKEFQVDLKGYNMEEVDHYLDVIKNDYENFAVMINEAYDDIERLEKENKLLVSKLNALEEEKMIQNDNMKAMEENMSSNIDILKRLSNLEKEVFKGK